MSGQLIDSSRVSCIGHSSALRKSNSCCNQFSPSPQILNMLRSVQNTFIKSYIIRLIFLIGWTCLYQKLDQTIFCTEPFLLTLCPRRTCHDCHDPLSDTMAHTISGVTPHRWQFSSVSYR